MKTKIILPSAISLLFFSCKESKVNALTNDLTRLEQEQKGLYHQLSEIQKNPDSLIAFDTALNHRLIHTEARLDIVKDSIKEVKEKIMLEK